MRSLLACTCLTPLALIALPGTAAAERVVDTRITTPLTTGTATNNAPDSIRITAAGTIELTAGNAITVNSSHNVTNGGTIQVNNASNANGILIQPGTSGAIVNTGTIRLLEDYTPTDTDNDGDLDGPLAQGSNRFAIRLAPGGTYAGNVTVGGTIEVEGNDSGGILLESRLNGFLVTSGSIAVTGSRAVGVRASDIDGAAWLRGSINVRGQDAVGIHMAGNISGALTIQSTVTATGFRSSTPPTDQSKLDADDLLRGGPAVRISGSVGGGVVFAVAPIDSSTTDDDEDDDGVPDAQEGSAAITSVGDAAAVEIGSATGNITLGAVAGIGRGLVVDGVVTGAGTYANFDGNGMVIGGLGGTVTIAGGMRVNGQINATSTNANATALRIGAGATVPEIAVGGIVRATGGGDLGDRARAILIDQGSSVLRIVNGGRIEATAGARGTAEAIVDRTGLVDQISNTGIIAAAGGNGTEGGAIAIDLSANTTGSTISQTAPSATGAAAPRITGDIRLGSGNDLVNVERGTVTGAVGFGAGANRMVLSNDAAYSGNATFGAGDDRITLSGTSRFSGGANFGGGNDILEISGTASFSGTVQNSAGLAVNVAGGTFRVTQTGSVALRSLNAGPNTVIGVAINGATGAHTMIEVAGAASFGAGSRIGARLFNISESEGRYTVLRAGTLTGAPTLGFDDGSLPFLFTGRVETTGNEVSVVISRRTAEALGLNRSRAAAYDAIFAALDRDEGIAGVFLNIGNAEDLRAQVGTMLPNHAGGVFETVTLGSRASARFLNDPSPRIADLGGGWGFWLQQVGWGTSKDLGDTAAYDVTGWGASAGAERRTSIGAFGGAFAYLAGEDADGDNDNEVMTEQFELSGYWRGSFGAFRAYARASAAWITMDSSRYFTGVDDEGRDVTRTARGSWSGQLYSAAAGMSYELRMGRLTLRPGVAIDYYRLSEDGYSEVDGGDGLNLTVEGRESDELAATATVAAGYEFGSSDPDEMRLRLEVEGGRRQILSGAIGSTVARFGDGDPFTLDADERSDGWTGALRLIGGQGATTLGGEVMAEEQSGRASVAFRVSLGFGF